MLIIVLAISLFVTNGLSIRSHVREHDRLYEAAMNIDNDNAPTGFEFAVVTSEGAVTRRSTLFADADMSEMVFMRRYNVLKRMRQRCSTGGGFLSAFDCGDRCLVATLVYVHNQRTDGTDMIAVSAIKKK